MDHADDEYGLLADQAKDRERRETFLLISGGILPIVFLFSSGIPRADTFGDQFLVLALTCLASLAGLFFAIKGYGRDALRAPSLVLVLLHILVLAFVILF